MEIQGEFPEEPFERRALAVIHYFAEEMERARWQARGEDGEARPCLPHEHAQAHSMGRAIQEVCQEVLGTRSPKGLRDDRLTQEGRRSYLSALPEKDVERIKTRLVEHYQQFERKRLYR